MQLLGKYVYVGQFDDGDPFLDSDKWGIIVKEVIEKYPGHDLILFRVKEMYMGLASISASLDPMALSLEMMQRGVFCMGSNQKVNLMTQSEFNEVIELLESNLESQ